MILSEHEGLTNQEIADALGVTLDTVKIRLHRARARLRKDHSAVLRHVHALRPAPRAPTAAWTEPATQRVPAVVAGRVLERNLAHRFPLRGIRQGPPAAAGGGDRKAALRMVDADMQGGVGAHRMADHVRLFDFQVIEEAHGILHHFHSVFLGIVRFVALAVAPVIHADDLVILRQSFGYPWQYPV